MLIKPSLKLKNIIWSTILTTLCILCFSVNLFVFTRVVTVKSYPVLFYIGWIVWAFGMVLVMAPIVTFPAGEASQKENHL